MLSWFRRGCGQGLGDIVDAVTNTAVNKKQTNNTFLIIIDFLVIGCWSL